MNDELMTGEGLDQQTSIVGMPSPAETASPTETASPADSGMPLPAETASPADSGMPSQEITQSMPQQIPPDVAEFYAGGYDELQVIYDCILKRDTLLAETKNLAKEGRQLEKQLADAQKNLNSEIEKTVNQERENYIAAEVKTISEGSNDLKKTRNERNKAKEKGVKDRIEQETSELILENKNIRRQIRKTLKENGLPSYCDTKWFYTLYCTQSFVQWIIKILVFIAGLVVIPGLVVWLADPWWFLKIVIWIVFIVIFLAVFLTIYLLTKDKDNGTLEEMREYRDKIDDNRKTIVKIKKNIKTDTDDSIYHLDQFDEKIAMLESMIQSATVSKEKKLKEFEEVKKQEIIDAINANRLPAIDQMKKEIDEKAGIYQEKNTSLITLSGDISEKYEKYLTKNYTNASAVKAMMDAISAGQAVNIGEAFGKL